MSNSGSGQFIRPDDLHVTIPLSWVLHAIEHLEDGTDEAKATAKGLAGCLPRIPTAHLQRLEGREDDDDDLEEVQP